MADFNEKITFQLEKKDYPKLLGSLYLLIYDIYFFRFTPLCFAKSSIFCWKALFFTGFFLFS